MHTAVQNWLKTRALLWVFFHRGWWPLLLAQLGAIAVASLIYTCLLLDGPIDQANGRSLHLLLVLMGMVACGGAAMTANGSARSLFLLPLSNSAMATAVLIPGVVAAAVMMAITAITLNQIYDVHWPIMGPAVCCGVLVAALQTVSQLTGERRWLAFLGWCVVSVMGAEWFRARYGGGWFLAPETMWMTITAREGMTLFLAMFGAAALFCWGVTRERSHQSFLNGVILKWRLRSKPHAIISRYRDAPSAQFWYEWQRKGWVLPATFCVTAVFLSLGYCQHRFANGEYELLHILLGYGTGLGPIALATGLVIGHVDFPQTNVECSSFLATRPLTNAALSGAVLKTVAISLTVTGVMWILGLMGTTAWLYTHQGMTPVLDLWTDHGRFTDALNRFGVIYPLLIVGSLLLIAWVGLTTSSLLVLTGRRGWILATVAAAVPVGLAGLLVAGLRSEGTVLFADEIWQTGIGLTLGLLTLSSIGMVAYRRLINTPTVFIIGAGWLALCGIAAGVSLRLEVWQPAFLVLLWGGLGLVVAPMATAPLAMSWNRHR